MDKAEMKEILEDAIELLIISSEIYDSSADAARRLTILKLELLA